MAIILPPLTICSRSSATARRGGSNRPFEPSTIRCRSVNCRRNDCCRDAHSDYHSTTALQVPQARKQRQPEQRQRPGEEAEHEDPEPAAAWLLDDGGLRRWGGDQRMFAFDHAARDVIGDGLDDNSDFMGLGDHDAAETRVLHEAVDALVPCHQNMGDYVDTQPRRIALPDAAIERTVLARNF